MDKRGKITAFVIALLFVLASFSCYFVLADSTVSSLRDYNWGIDGIKVVNFSVDDYRIEVLDYNSPTFNLKNEFVGDKGKIKQSIYLKNNLLSNGIFNFSIIVEINYSEVRWNGTRYKLTNNPFIFDSWYDFRFNEQGKLIAPDIFLDDEYNKRIDYKDMAEKGGYAIAYSKEDKYYVELKIDNLNIDSLTEFYLDPTYSNFTDGWATDYDPYGIAKIGDYFYILSNNGHIVRQYYVNNKSFTGNSFTTDAIGAGNPTGLTTNGTDLLINDLEDRTVYFVNTTGSSLSGGFSTTACMNANSWGVAANATDVWVSFPGYYICHFDRLRNNLTGINAVGIGADGTVGVNTDNGGEFWFGDGNDLVMYHSDISGNNLSDGFDIGSFGVDTPYGSFFDVSDKSIWQIDLYQAFVYHLVDSISPNITQPVITPSNPESSDNLNCYATLTDNMQTNLVAYWKWYKNDVSYLSGNSNVTNGTYSLITTLNAENTTAGDSWTCEVLPFDGYNYGSAVNSSAVTILVGITFNVTDSYYGTPLNNVLISCNSTGFSQEGDTTNPYGPYGFAPGSYTCEFEKTFPEAYYNKTIAFIAESDKTVNVSMAESGFLSEEEHTWLEWLYNCWNYGNCQNLLTNMNQTLSNDYILTQAINSCVVLGDCTLYNMIMNINNNTINGLQEHTWLQAIYDCTNTENCTLYNNLYTSLIKVNQTLVNIWQRLTGTDRSVILQENITSYYLSPSTNIEINYTIKIPYKEGVPINELLPIRLYFWFTDVNKTNCYNQDKRLLQQQRQENIAEYPYCLPLVAETLGPNNGTKTFKVSLRPSLSTGTYNITRSVEIDPLGIWTQYGRGDIGQIEVLNSGDASLEISNENNINSVISSSSSSNSESSSESTRKVTNIYNYYTNENKEDEQSEKLGEDTIYLNKPGITGGVIGSLLSEGSLVFIVAMFVGLLVVFIISRTMIKLKKK